MLATPRLRPGYRARVLPSEAVVLLSETGEVVLRGMPLCERVLPLVDGCRTADEIAKQLEGVASATEVYYLLFRLEQEGYLVEAGGCEAPGAALWRELHLDPAAAAHSLAGARVSVHSLGSVPAPDGIAALRTAGLAAGGGCDLTLVLVDDYLQEGLEEWNRRSLETGRPWLLVKPSGVTAWIGPLFRPGVTGCWECLAQRLRVNRPLARYIQQRTGGPDWAGRPAPSMAATVQAALSLAAAQAAKWLAGSGSRTVEGKIVTLDLLSLETQSHHLVRRPQCPRCGEAGRTAGEAAAPAPTPHSASEDGKPAERAPDRVFARYQHHISPITGLVSHLVRSPELPEDESDLVHNYVTGPLPAGNYPNLDWLLRHVETAAGSGGGVTDAQAKASALCEALERYSALFQGGEPRRQARYRELGDCAIHPNAFMLYSDEQYRRRQELNARRWRFQEVCEPFDEDWAVDWTSLHSLSDGRIKYLPTACCYLAYPSPGHPVFCRGNSNGNAAGATLEHALLSGFLELVERDAAAIWWYNRLQRPAVDLATFDEPYVEGLRRLYDRLHRELWVLDITSDFGIPVFAAVSRRTDKPVEDITYGFGAHFDPRSALLRALREVNQALPAVSPIRADGTGSYNYADQCAIEWWQTATLAKNRYLAPDPAVPPRRAPDYPTAASEDPFDDIRRCERLVRERGMELLVLDLTRPDVGLPVARVVVPGMRHFWERFAPGRLYDVPVQLGWLDKPRAERELNRFPIFV